MYMYTDRSRADLYARERTGSRDRISQIPRGPFLTRATRSLAIPFYRPGAISFNRVYNVPPRTTVHAYRHVVSAVAFSDRRSPIPTELSTPIVLSRATREIVERADRPVVDPTIETRARRKYSRHAPEFPLACKLRGALASRALPSLAPRALL